MDEKKYLARHNFRKTAGPPRILPPPKVDEMRLARRSAFLEMGAVPEGVKIIHVPGYPPLKHQVVAYDSALGAPYFALLMEMSTMKTATTLMVACERARQSGRQFRMLVVAPKTVCGSWVDEVVKHATLPVNVEVLRGTGTQRRHTLAALLNDTETSVLLAVVNYEGALSLEAELRSVQWDLMVCDEAIWIKNPTAKRSKACFRIGRSAASRMILTGMPITRNILDLYGLYHFLEPGLLGFTSLYAYQNYYCNLDFFGSYKGYKADRLPELMDRIARVSFVVKRAQCIDLPEKIHKVIKVEMGKEQSAAYDMMLERAIVDLEQEINEAPSEARAASAVAKIIRLAQITSGYLPDTEGRLHRFSPNPKLEAVDEYIEALPPDEKVVIWARFREDLDLLAEHYKDRGAVSIHGGVNDTARDEARHRFLSDPTCLVFIGQPQAGGFGINELVVSAHCIYFSNTWSLQDRGQSEDRLMRYGQARAVTYNDIVVPNTVDDLILSRLREKKELSDLLTDRRALLSALKTEHLKRNQ